MLYGAVVVNVDSFIADAGGVVPHLKNRDINECPVSRPLEDSLRKHARVEGIWDPIRTECRRKGRS
jgi:hypothetical protein